MVAFHHSTTSRPATEETLLSMYLSDDDVTSAEFIRLYFNLDFYGSCLLRALEREQEQRGSSMLKKEEQKRNTPQISSDIGDAILYMQHFEILYGYRPADPVIFFLNAWEFLMWWTVMPKNTCTHMLRLTSYLIFLKLLYNCVRNIF